MYRTFYIYRKYYFFSFRTAILKKHKKSKVTLCFKKIYYSK